MAQDVILAIQNDQTDPPHLVGKWLEEIGFKIRIVHAYKGEAIPKELSDDICALMPLGGHMGALDDVVAPWLKAERELLAKAVAKDFPIFAICLGAQLLAAATDGEIARMKTNEIGIYEINSVASDEIVNFGDHALTTQWHEDQVVKLPSGATRLASSELCPNQIFRMGTHIYAFQSHPEVDAGIVTRWEADADNAFLQSGAVSVKERVRKAEAQLEETWKPIVQKWGRSIKK